MKQKKKGYIHLPHVLKIQELNGVFVQLIGILHWLNRFSLTRIVFFEHIDLLLELFKPFVSTVKSWWDNQT